MDLLIAYELTQRVIAISSIYWQLLLCRWTYWSFLSGCVGWRPFPDIIFRDRSGSLVGMKGSRIEFRPYDVIWKRVLDGMTAVKVRHFWKITLVTFEVIRTCSAVIESHNLPILHYECPRELHSLNSCARLRNVSLKSKFWVFTMCENHILNTANIAKIKILYIRKLMCMMACFTIIRLLKVSNNVIHESLLILIRGLPISQNFQSVVYWMLIPEIDPINDTFCNFSRERVIVKEHIECFGDSWSGRDIMRELLLHNYYQPQYYKECTFKHFGRCKATWNKTRANGIYSNILGL